MGAGLRVVVLLLLMLAACSTPQQPPAATSDVTTSSEQYPNARRWFLAFVEKDTADLRSKYSPALLAQFNDCLWRYMSDGLTPVELLDLDQHAMEWGKLDPKTLHAFAKRADSFGEAVTGEGLDWYCPSTIAAMRAMDKTAAN